MNNEEILMVAESVSNEKDLPKDITSIFISSVAQKGITELKDLIWKKLNN